MPELVISLEQLELANTGLTVVSLRLDEPWQAFLGDNKVSSCLAKLHQLRYDFFLSTHVAKRQSCCKSGWKTGNW